MPEIIKLENVWVFYGNTPVLETINLSVYQQDFLGIIGPNGGGKTTLLKIIIGLVKPTLGKVTILGASPDVGKRFVGYVPQQTPLDREFPVSVLDVVLMGRIGRVGLFRRYSHNDIEIAYEALKKVEVFDLKDRHMGELSLGQRQRVLIARALAVQPKILLLDEPTTSVDKPTETEFYELLNRLKRDVTIVLVTHDIGVVSAYVEKIACLNRKLYYHGSKEIIPEELSETYKCPVQLIAHGAPHIVFKKHEENKEKASL